MSAHTQTPVPHTHTPVPKVSTLVAVWVALIVFTVVTTLVSYVELGEWNVVVALIIAVTKASIVAWVFMGVRYSTTLARLFCIAGLVWLLIMILLTFSDYSTRNWSYQPQPWSNTPAGGASR
jgi:cytochrome c oxidase subunit IV